MDDASGRRGRFENGGGGGVNTDAILTDDGDAVGIIRFRFNDDVDEPGK